MNILSIQEGHTATAALSINNEIVSCVSEERFSKKKISKDILEMLLILFYQNIKLN